MNKISSFGQTLRSDEKKRKQLMVFLFFLLLSAFFWLLIKLSDNYTVSYAYPVKITNVPPDQFLQNPESNILPFAVASSGYEILRINLLNSKRKVINIPLNIYNYREINSKTFAISTSQLREKLSEQLNLSESEILFNSSDIIFEMEKLTSKVVPIRLITDLKFRNEYNLYDSIDFTPKKITVYGPANLLDSIQYINSSILKAEDIHKSFSQDLNLEIPNLLLKTNVSKITLNADIARFTEVKFNVPVHLPEKSSLKLFPEKVNVYFSVALRDYTFINPDQFFVEVDTNHLSSRPKYLAINLSSKPKKVKVLRLEPEKVEYLIIKP